jgi:hypothetical protein
MVKDFLVSESYFDRALGINEGSIAFPVGCVPHL